MPHSPATDAAAPRDWPREHKLVIQVLRHIQYYEGFRQPGFAFTHLTFCFCSKNKPLIYKQPLRQLFLHPPICMNAFNIETKRYVLPHFVLRILWASQLTQHTTM